MTIRINKQLKLSLIIVLIMAIFIGVIALTKSLTASPYLVDKIADFGYLGVMFTAIIAGLNTFVPLPAATFTPLFLEAGLSLSLVILFLAIGTTIADFVGFALGHASREVVKDKYPRIFNYFYTLQEKRRHLIFPLVLIYSAFIPFPNEAILIPLALAGVNFKKLLLPLIIANITHQLLVAYGVNWIFSII